MLVLIESLLDNLLAYLIESLLESDLESLLESLLENLIESLIKNQMQSGRESDSTVCNRSGYHACGPGSDQKYLSVRFQSHPNPDPLLFGGSILDLDLSTCGCCRVLPDLSGAISGAACQVVLSMVGFRIPTVNRKILKKVHHCSLSTNWPPIKSKIGETHSLPHPGNERQQNVINFWSCIGGDLCGDWLWPFVNAVLAGYICIRQSYTLTAPSWKWGSAKRQRFKVSNIGQYMWHVIADLYQGGIGYLSTQISKRHSCNSLPDSNHTFHLQYCN